MRRTHALLTIAVAGMLAAATGAQAAEHLKLSVSLKPEHLGQGTTIGFNLKITSDTGPLPPPLTAINLYYPDNLGIALSGVGLDTCPLATLELFGPDGCPAEAHMGYGSVLAEIAIGPAIIQEHASLSVLRTTTQNGHISLLFFANGQSPVDAQIVFAGALLPAEPPFGGLLEIEVPLVASIPGAPDVAVTEILGTLGPQHLTYYRPTGRKFVAYTPQGILLPRHCPRNGFPFAAELAFLGGTHTRAAASVPCP